MRKRCSHAPLTTVAFEIQPIDLETYAEIQRRQDARIFRHGLVYWRQVRPFFFRPLLPYEQVEDLERSGPGRWPCAFQYVTTNPDHANSSINFLVFDGTRHYALETLGKKRRWQINAAAKHFTIRPIVQARELIEGGHRAYVSFYERTHYEFKRERTQKEHFATWANNMFLSPASFVLGAFGKDGLAAVSVSFWVAQTQTLLYSTLFAETGAQRSGVCELMLHELRVAVARQPGISRILLRPYQGGNSHDQYYLLRGAALCRRPARLHISRGLDLLLKWLVPAQYARLYGLDEVQEAKSAAGGPLAQDQGSRSEDASPLAAAKAPSSKTLT